MLQSDLNPHHTAIIMDGNGRWAKARGLPRGAGHREGAVALRRTVQAAPAQGIHVLTLYAFSSDNWSRPPEEVSALMDLLACHLISEAEYCAQEGVRLSLIGRRDRLPDSVLRAAEHAEARTSAGKNLHLRLAVDYSARDSIVLAARRAQDISRHGFSSAFGDDVDLLIRTGGEQRLSDFLLWECAYAELVFTPRMWPDFDAADLLEATETYRNRERRFGRVDLCERVSLPQLWTSDEYGPVSDLRGDRWLR